MARLGGRTLGDQDLLESSLLSPATAIVAETAVLEATAGSDGILVESVAWEVDAAAIRGSVTVLESADAARHDAFEVIDHLLGRQLGIALLTGAPVLVAGVPLALTVGGDGLIDGPRGPGHRQPAARPAPGQRRRRPARRPHRRAAADARPPTTPRTCSATSTRRAVRTSYRVHTSTGDQPSSVEDLLDHLSDIAALSHGADSAANGTIEIQTVTNADGQVVHIVNLPGTDDLGTLPWTADDDVRDLGTNLDLVAGEQDDYQQGILEAMHAGGHRPGRPGADRRALAGRHGGGRDPRERQRVQRHRRRDRRVADGPGGALPGRVPRPVDRAARRPGAAARRRAQPAVGRADDGGRRRPSRVRGSRRTTATTSTSPAPRPWTPRRTRRWSPASRACTSTATSARAGRSTSQVFEITRVP